MVAAGAAAGAVAVVSVVVAAAVAMAVVVAGAVTVAVLSLVLREPLVLLVGIVALAVGAVSACPGAALDAERAEASASVRVWGAAAVVEVERLVGGSIMLMETVGMSHRDAYCVRPAGMGLPSHHPAPVSCACPTVHGAIEGGGEALVHAASSLSRNAVNHGRHYSI